MIAVRFEWDVGAERNSEVRRLAAVPREGDWVELSEHSGRVEDVRWILASGDEPVVVRLRPFAA